MEFAVFSPLVLVFILFVASCYRQWSRRHEGWAPPPLSPEEAGGAPYRAVTGDPRLRRPAPGVVHVATASAAIFGSLFVVAGVEVMAFAAGFACSGPAWFPTPPLGLLGALATVTGVQLFRAGPVLLGGDAVARRAASQGAAWTTGLGVVAFAILFFVLGGAFGEHDGRLCLALLSASFAAIGASAVFRRAHEAIPDSDE
jgi:hypothetical protein